MSDVICKPLKDDGLVEDLKQFLEKPVYKEMQVETKNGGVVSPADHDVPDEQLFENLPVMLVACDDQKRTLAWNHECERVDGIPGRIR